MRNALAVRRRYAPADGAKTTYRAKDVIIAHGRKYHPQDLEWAVDDLAGVRRGRVVAFGTAGAGRADRVVMVVEPNGTVPAASLTRLRLCT